MGEEGRQRQSVLEACATITLYPQARASVVGKEDSPKEVQVHKTSPQRSPRGNIGSEGTEEEEMVSSINHLSNIVLLTSL